MHATRSRHRSRCTLFGPRVAHSIISANSRGLHIIRDFADVQSLPELWAVPNDAVDLFVVASIPLKDGWSPRPGKCPTLIDKNLRSSAASLSGDKFNSGNTFAHEVGHFLGLPHAESEPTNPHPLPASVSKGHCDELACGAGPLTRHADWAHNRQAISASMIRQAVDGHPRRRWPRSPLGAR
jgi:hypothetical protein